jgi:hypothetical protein
MTQPKEKIDDNPKIFLIFFCFTLPSLLSTALNTPSAANQKVSLLSETRIKGIIFCQIERTQIRPQVSFWISFKYQN